MLLSLKTSPTLHRLHFSFQSLRPSSPSPPLFSPLNSYLRRRPAAAVLSLSSSSSTAAAVAPTMSSAPVQTIEHFVLFKVRDSTEPSKIDAMISNLSALASLDAVSHLFAGPILRHRSSAAAALGFTHLLHSRYRSKSDLAAYADHPDHVAAVKEYVLPICEDVMAVDWVAQTGDDAPAPPPGSAVRLNLLKHKEGEKKALLEVLAGAKEAAGEVVMQVSYGENFSPARAKGYTLGFLMVFSGGVEEIDTVEKVAVGSMEAFKVKVRLLIDGLIGLDFLVPQPNTANH